MKEWMKEGTKEGTKEQTKQLNEQTSVGERIDQIDYWIESWNRLNYLYIKRAMKGDI